MRHSLRLSPTGLFSSSFRATQRPPRLWVIFSVLALFIGRSTKKRRIAAALLAIPKPLSLPRPMECRLCLTAPQAKFIQVYIVRRRTLSERSRTRGLIRNCYADADAARVFRREPLSKVSGTPSLAFAHVACISARKASDTASDRRSPRATRLTYDGSHPTFCATRL